MNLNLIFWILGIFVTIIIGYLSIKSANKFKRRIRLLYFENSCISLFKSVVKDLDELEIKYKGNTVKENLIIYKGTFFNSGNIDIDKNLIYKPLKLLLPADYEWKKVKIIDQSEDVNLEFEQKPEKPNEIQFSWDILKENEFFTFDSVIEYKPKKSSKDESKLIISDITKNLSRKITFSQRITNLKSIDKEKLPSKPIGWFGFLFINLYFLAIVILGLFWSAGQFVYPSYKVTHEVMIDSTLSFVFIKPHSKSEVKLVNSLGKDFTIKSVNQLNQVCLTGKIKTQKNDLSYLGLIGGGLLALMMFILLLVVITTYINEKRLYKLIKQIADKYDVSDFPERRSSRFMFPL